jgi:hypothetical protein
MPEKVDYEKEGKPEKNLIRISDHSLELVSVFKEAIKNFTFIFLFNKNQLRICTV